MPRVPLQIISNLKPHQRRRPAKRSREVHRRFQKKEEKKRPNLSKQAGKKEGRKGRHKEDRACKRDKQREITGYQTFRAKTAHRWKIKWPAARVRIRVRACVCVSGARDGITIIWASTTERVGGTVAVRHIVINLVPSARCFTLTEFKRMYTQTGTGEQQARVHLRNCCAKLYESISRDRRRWSTPLRYRRLRELEAKTLRRTFGVALDRF